MLGGIDPILIFQFKNSFPKVSDQLSKIPLVNDIPTIVEEPPIPVYLSERLTGLIIDNESKNIDASTSMETKTDGSDPDVNQKGVGSVVSIDIIGKKDSIGLTLLSAFAEKILDKMTSKEYAVSYLNGPITVFRGVMHSFSVSQSPNTDKLMIKLEISRGDARRLKSGTLNNTANPNPPVTRQDTTFGLDGQPIPAGAN